MQSYLVTATPCAFVDAQRFVQLFRLRMPANNHKDYVVSLGNKFTSYYSFTMPVGSLGSLGSGEHILKRADVAFIPAEPHLPQECCNYTDYSDILRK